MLERQRALIAEELTAGTGAAIAIAVNSTMRRTGLDIWFDDLDRNHGPIAELRPHGLRSHQVDLYLGKFAGGILRSVNEAPQEDVRLARALIASIHQDVEVLVNGQSQDDWLIRDGSFRMTARIRHQAQTDAPDAIVATCREVIVPMMAAMAELIGYDEVEVSEAECMAEMEGQLSRREVILRERNPRNRVLCLRVHGHRCKICGLKPADIYGTAGAILEVHHLQPVSLLSEPRPYDPQSDLVPLCPNCHRAVHTRRPCPLAPEELREMMGVANV